MKHISILIPKGQYSIVNIAGCYQMLEAASDMFAQRSGNQLCQIDLVAAVKPAADRAGLFTINPSKTLNQIKTTDLIIIPAVHNDIEEVIKDNQEEIEWIKNQYKKGTEIATFCIGVYLLAETGLLDGKLCSTHWGYAQDLQKRYPLIHVMPENIVAESEGIYTSGGAYAFTNLVVYLIEKFGGRELAILAAKSFMIDIDKGSQSPFIIFSGQKEHKDEVVLQVQEYIEMNYADKFTVDQLADNHATIRRTLERRFKKATGNSVNEYAQRVRIEAAKKQLELGRKSVNEVIYDVGYNDAKAFRNIFKRWVGISPVDYKSKYNKQYA